MRKSFAGLSGLVYSHMGDPQDGSYFVFINRPRNKVKILHFDGDGLTLWYKRLEKGTFVLPPGEEEKCIINRRSLAMILEGVVAKSIKPRYERNS